jgi:hypothetical protein
MIVLGQQPDAAPSDPAARQALAMAMIGRGLGGFGQQQAMDQLLHGKAGPGLGKLAAKGAPGLDASLVGPSLGLTGNKMARPGLMTGRDPDDEGGYRALLQQAFASRGGFGGGGFGFGGQ